MTRRLLAIAIVSAPLALALALIAMRAVLSLYYGGGAASFDQRYEPRIARQVEAASSQREAFAHLADHWQPDPLWRREILYPDGAPADLCTAEAGQTPAGRGVLMIACGNVDGFRPVGTQAHRQHYLAEQMHERALWAIARVLRMSGERYREIGVVAVHQTQTLRTDDQAIYFAALELPDSPPELEVLLSDLDARLRIVENSAGTRRAAITSR